MIRRLCAVALLVATSALADPPHQEQVGTSAVRVDNMDGSQRKSVTVQAIAANTGKIYCAAGDPAVSTGSGQQFVPGGAYIWDENGGSGVHQKIYCISDTAAQNVAVFEDRK